jgi:hypothetical protein
LAFLALNAASIGLWATFAPRSWFDNFPGPGSHWVAADGVYNHHLAADVGALWLALFVVTVAALVSGSRPLVRVVGAAWLVEGVPHLLYHLGNRAALPGSDQIAELAGLAVQIFIALFCLVASGSSQSSDETENIPKPTSVGLRGDVSQI